MTTSDDAAPRATPAAYERDAYGLLFENAARSVAAAHSRRFPEMDPLSTEAGIMLTRAYGALVGLVSEYWASVGLTQLRYNVLSQLYFSEQRRLTMGEVGTGLHIKPNSVTKVIDGMENDGLVFRTPAARDRRTIYACLTPSGQECFEQVHPETASRLQSAWADFDTDEKRTLIHMLAKLRQSILLPRHEHPNSALDGQGSRS